MIKIQPTFWGTEQLKKVVSMPWRRRIARSRVSVRQLTGSFRALPNVLIIGAQRCGTSSLYKYLEQHPEVDASIRKETQYFTEFAHRREAWYRAHFRLSLPFIGAGTRVTFEATPDYLLDPRCPARAIALLGDVRVVALLRDPVERAFSHYQHNRRRGTEPLSFEDALESEGDRLAGFRKLMREQPDAPLTKEYARFSYVTRGLYAEQLEHWLEFFPLERMFITSSEDFFRDTPGVFGRLTAFLGLSQWTPAAFSNFSYVASDRGAGNQTSMNENTRLWLRTRFRESNESLFDLLGCRFQW